MKISERILQEAFLSARPGQLDRLSVIAAEVEKLEALARRVEEAPVFMAERYVDTTLGPDGNGGLIERHEIYAMLEVDAYLPESLAGQRVAVVRVDEDDC